MILFIKVEFLLVEELAICSDRDLLNIQYIQCISTYSTYVFNHKKIWHPALNQRCIHEVVICILEMSGGLKIMNSGRECSVVSSSKWPFRTDYNPYMVRRFRNFLIRTFYYYNRVSSVPRRLFWFVLSKSNKKSIYRTRSERGQLLNTNFAFQENFSLNMEANKHQVGTYSIKFSDQSV